MNRYTAKKFIILSQIQKEEVEVKWWYDVNKNQLLLTNYLVVGPTCDPLKYKMDYHILIVSTCMGKSIRMKRVKQQNATLQIFANINLQVE